MTPVRLITLCCGALLAVACTKTATFTEPLGPRAAIHFVNAVPDTNQQDIHLVDIASNAGLYNAPFRASNMFYQGIEAGGHHFRAFEDSTDVVVASTILADTTLTIAANASYTLIHAGYLRTGQVPAHQLWFIPDTPPTPAAGQIAVRIIHAGAGMGNIDVNVVKHAVNPVTADSLPDTPMFSNLAYGTAGAYVSMPWDSLTTDSARVVVTATGTKTVTFTLLLPLGIAGTSTSNPIAGARVAGSVMTAVVVPASVAGSHAPQGGLFANPNAVILVDRRPPNTAP
ncbi:MAG TPA: DUF4397 domain-containing protein [Gemmatimonadales bacterium]